MKRLRPAHSDDELRRIYSAPHSTEYFVDHHVRVDATIAVGKFMLEYYDPYCPSIADLSCGDAKIPEALSKVHKACDLYLGDYAPGYKIQGPIEHTLNLIPKVDLFVLSETLEHIDRPQELLLELRKKTSMLLLSTPIDEPEDSNNEQHYWSWSVKDVRSMLSIAGFDVTVMNLLRLPTYYDFMILGAK
jgi:hypothetical protein